MTASPYPPYRPASAASSFSALADNAGAIEFYWRRGGKPIAEVTELIGGAKLKKIAFEWN